MQLGFSLVQTSDKGTFEIEGLEEKIIQQEEKMEL